MTKIKHPVIWIIGATRSSKTALASALAEGGGASLGFHLISTGNYFRGRYGQPDTMNRAFVFNISSFAADCLEQAPSCHQDALEDEIVRAQKPCIVEGERNPLEFAKLYDPKRDMVFLLKRVDVDTYDTLIEKGLAVIEQQVRWCVNTGIAPVNSVCKITYGNTELKFEQLGKHDQPDSIIMQGPVKERDLNGQPEHKYPWINILIGIARQEITDYYKSDKNFPTSCLTLP